MSQIIYRQPIDIGRICWTVPVWQTDRAMRIQNRLLGAILPHQHLSMACHTRFPSYIHGRVLAELHRCGGDLLDLLPDCSGPVLDVLMQLSWYFDQEFTREEIQAMDRTIGWYWRMQQHAMRSLEQAASAWNGRQHGVKQS